MPGQVRILFLNKDLGIKLREVCQQTLQNRERRITE
jgi:hypothetical protein